MKLLFLSTLFLAALFAQSNPNSKPEPPSPGGDPPKPPTAQAPKNIEFTDDQERDFLRLYRAAADADNMFHALADSFREQIEQREDYKSARAKAQLTKEAFQEAVNQLLLSTGCRDCKIAYHDNGKPYLTSAQKSPPAPPVPSQPAPSQPAVKNPKPGEPKK